MDRGLYDGWDAGQSAYDQSGAAAEPGAPPPASGAPPEVRRGEA
jgi:hypothetical protein